MKRNTPQSGEILDRAVREIREMAATPDNEEAILARVKSALQTENANFIPEPALRPSLSKPYLTCCEDFQSLIPEYLSSRLASSRAMLLQDHLMECATCWNVFEAGAGKSRTAPQRPVDLRFVPVAWKWKAAAAIAVCSLIMVAVLTQTSLIRNFMWPV